jgi:hypothetical protein
MDLVFTELLSNAVRHGGGLREAQLVNTPVNTYASWPLTMTHAVPPSERAALTNPAGAACT